LVVLQRKETHMNYFFDKPVDRRGTDALKLEGLEQFFGQSGLTPLWVADMDFECPPEVTEALTRRAAHPVYGYTLLSDRWYEAILQWNKRRHNWSIPKEHIAFCPGIVPGLALLTDAVTHPGDKILIQTPVYHPFYSIVSDQQRELVTNPLICTESGRYIIDFDDLEKKLADNVKMMILCHPHNPVGRDWEEKELRKILQLCAANDVLLVSDEIHADLIIAKKKHPITASISAAERPVIITCMSASKTFNMGGLFTAYMIFENPLLKQKYDAILKRYHIYGNLFGFLALEEAYNQGEAWLEALLNYLRGNIRFVDEFLSDQLPEVTFHWPEATYLLWLDFRRLGLPQHALKELLIRNARLALNNGTDFGADGEGFMRLNIACPQATLKNALIQLKIAVDALK